MHHLSGISQRVSSQTTVHLMLCLMAVLRLHVRTAGIQSVLGGIPNAQNGLNACPQKSMIAVHK
jgi:hypothetical protein